MRGLFGLCVISAKIPRRLKELTEALGIEPEPIIGRALEEAKIRVFQKLEKEVVEIRDKPREISDEEIVKLIR